MHYTLTVNGHAHTVDVDADTPLLWVLRDAMNLKGTLYGCGHGLCGACTVQVDGVAMPACQIPISELGAAKVITIEGIGDTPAGKRVMEAWLKVDVMQCGYCQSGQIVAAASLLAQTPKPSDAEIMGALDGHLCRCGTYTRIKQAVKLAAQEG